MKAIFRKIKFEVCFFFEVFWAAFSQTFSIISIFTASVFGVVLAVLPVVALIVYLVGGEK